MAKVVLHIHSLDLGGAERVTIQWARWLLEADHQVWILVGKQIKQPFFDLPENLTVVCRSESRCAPLFSTVFWLRQWLRSHPPDLAIGITSRPALNLLIASQGRPWPVVVAERNFPPAKPLPRIWALLRDHLYPRAHLHLVQTQRIGDWLQEQKLAKRAVVVPNAVHWPLPGDIPFVSPESLLPATACMLLAVGTKPHQKGFDRLIKAFDQVAPVNPNCWLVIVGVEANHSELLPALKSLGEQVRQRVLLPGRVGNLVDWYRRASVFVLASRFEGFPNVLQEAMAAGCACLAIDCPTGPRELLHHDFNGVLLPEHSGIAALANALNRLIADPSRRESLGRAARGVQVDYAPELISRRFLQALQPCFEPLVLVLAPTRRSPTETFVRANLDRLPLRQVAYFGDEFDLFHPLQLAYGLAIAVSKVLTRLGWHRLATIPGSLAAWGLIRWHRPNVLLVEFGFHAVRVMDACRWTPVPLVVHFRGSDASADRRLGQLQERYRRLIKLAKAFVVKSQPMQKVLMGLGAPEEAITISPSGANQALFHGGQPAQAAPLVLFVGRFVAKKAPLDALDAFAMAREQASQDLAAAMRLVMVGDGPLRRDVEQRRQALALEHQVLLPGLQSAEQVAEWLRRSRCLLLPSRTAPDGDAEGCPVVVMEAQLAGIPVVSTFHAGIPEVVVDGHTGLLAGEGDRAGLASALLRLLDAPQSAAEMGEAGAKWAAANFTVGHHVETLAGVLRRQAKGI